jgi:hypothetical protein
MADKPKPQTITITPETVRIYPQINQPEAQ